MINPVVELLPRQVINEDLRYLITNSSLIIDECNNYGTIIIKKFYTSDKLRDDEIVSLLILRSIVELSDSISVLLQNSVMDPSKTLLRSLLESYFNLEYILEGNTKKKALAYLVWNTHEQNKFYETLNPSTQKGIKFQAKLREDRYFSNTKIMDSEKYLAAYQNNEELLKLTEYQIQKQFEVVFNSRRFLYSRRSVYSLAFIRFLPISL
jgi:hypothetical protein